MNRRMIAFVYWVILWSGLFAGSHAETATRYPLSPLCFVENQGMYPSQVLFYTKTAQTTLFFGLEGVWISGVRSIENDETKVRITNCKMNFHGARPEKIYGLEKQEYKIHDFRGDDPRKWHRNIPTFGRICYQNLYPKIDLIYHSLGGRLKYEYHLKPGANPDEIKVIYENIRSLSMDQNGDLIVDTDFGTIRDTHPLCYQTIGHRRVTVPSKLKLMGKNGYGFEIGAHDPSYPLVIDPLIYSTFLGGSSDDFGYATALDSSGNVYVTGRTLSQDFPTILGSYDTDFNGAQDVFVSKISSDGSTLLYSTFLGGDTSDYGRAIAVDGSGRVFITGQTFSSNFPTTQGAYDTSYNGSSDIFVVKLSSDGSTLLYSTFLGQKGWDAGYAITLDYRGYVFITGETDSANFPTVNAYDSSHNGGSDAFVARLNPNGSSLEYSTFLGGDSNDIGYAIAVDGSGNAFITGETNSINFPTTGGAYDTSHNGDSDVFVAKLSSSGSSLVYSTFLGGDSEDRGYGIAIDGSGNAFVTGEAQSKTFPTTQEAYDTSHNGLYDVFVSKLSENGSSLVYSTFVGGSNWDCGEGITLGSDGDVYIVGSTESPDFPTTPIGHDTSHNGEFDVFLIRLNANGTTLVYSTFIGGTEEDRGSGVAIESNGNVCVTGRTYSTDFPATAGAYDTSYNGGSDVFVAKLDPGHIVSTPNQPNGPSYGEKSENLTYTTGGSTCDQGHSVEYRFDWGDGTPNSDWSVTTSVNHSYADRGHYSVKSQARCVVNHNVISEESVKYVHIATFFMDFDRNGSTDFSVWKKTDGEWRWVDSGDSTEEYKRFGETGSLDYIIVPGDYDGDKKTDVAVWNKTNGKTTSGEWKWTRSSDGVRITKKLGETGVKDWIPVSGDYDGDKKTDVAVWNKTTGEWKWIGSSDNLPHSFIWGNTGVTEWIPVPGDYDGDGTTDFCVWNKNTGNWKCSKSSGGEFDTPWQSGGLSQWIPVPGDYDGDLKTDMAVWHKTSGEWRCQKSSDLSSIVKQWRRGGNLGWIPVPGDYDGDGKIDLSVWHKKRGQWYCCKSSDGNNSYLYRILGDQGLNRWIPVPQLQHVYLGME